MNHLLPPPLPGPEVTRQLGNLLQAACILDPTLSVSIPALEALTDGLDLTPAQEVAVAERLLRLAAMAGALARALNERDHNLGLMVDMITDRMVVRSWGAQT